MSENRMITIPAWALEFIMENADLDDMNGQYRSEEMTKAIDVIESFTGEKERKMRAARLKSLASMAAYKKNVLQSEEFADILEKLSNMIEGK